MSNDIPYRVERSANRHSRAAFRNGEIVIRLARRLSAQEQREHIETLLRRMHRQLERDRSRVCIDPFGPLLQGASEHTAVLDNGRLIPVRLQPAPSLRHCVTDGTLAVGVAADTDRKQLHRRLWRALGELLQPTVAEWVHDLNAATLQVPVDRVRLRLATTRWGSCSANGSIMLNTALLFLPSDLCEYVIIHELAHRVHANHSSRFWNVIAKWCPDYKEQRAMLKAYRLPVV